MSKKVSQKVTNNAREAGYFSQELFDEICARIADGQSLNRVCAESGKPSRKTFFQWIAKEPALKAEYLLAVDMRADYHAEEIIEIADDTAGDEEGGVEHIQRAKLRVDARKWYAARLAPKKYGDKMAIGGTEDLPPVQQVTRIELVALAANDNSKD